ncbi:MAG: biopolymer transporter Tol [Bacteroidota bacterium]
MAALFSFSFAFSQEDFYHHPELRWFTIETDHFLVHYQEGAERTADVVAKVAEDIYLPITSFYHHEPSHKVSFVIKDYDDISNGAAYFYDNKVEIWAPSMNFDLRGIHNWLRNVVTHEFTHIIQVQTAMKFGRRFPAIYLQWLGYEAEQRTDVLYGFPNVLVSYPLSGFNVPAWFAEGVAQFNRPELSYDFWDSHRDMILRMYALKGEMLSWDEMALFGKTSLGNESSYNAGFAFVQYLVGTIGPGVLEKISRNLGSVTTLTVDAAIERATGKDAQQLYAEWKDITTRDYRSRVAPIEAQEVEGNLIADVGFGNFYPTFSPDGNTIAYVSTKTGDYFSQSALYLYDLATQHETKVVGGVYSSISWSPDGNNLLYARRTRKNKHWSLVFDLFEYDRQSRKERRLTHGLRAYSPAYSPDGSTIVFVFQRDGTQNLATMDVSGSDVTELTHFSHGEQVYNPRWSPDGQRILFGWSVKDGQDIAMIGRDGSDLNYLIRGQDDSRHPTFSPDGLRILFASDRTGVFNIYSMDLENNSISQLTNVVGGAFMPSLSPGGDLVYASYRSTGYKIALLKNPKSLDFSGHQYIKREGQERESRPALVLAEAPQNPRRVSASDGILDWSELRNYDDAEPPKPVRRKYRNTFTSISLFPLVRFDNYNRKNSGIDQIKLGFYFASGDVIDKLNLFGSAALNKRAERDLFFILEVREKLPLLYALGLRPTLSLEVYNITRKTDFNLPLRSDLIIPVDVTFSLLEFDVAFKQKIFNEKHDLEVRYIHSRYNSSISSFILPESQQLVPGSREAYLIGNDVAVTWTYRGVRRSRDQSINPIGRIIRLRYDYEFNKFNPRFDVNDRNELVRIYDEPTFSRIDAEWWEHFKLPHWKHTLSARLRGATILGPTQDDFFDFYIGGLIGMRGYPYYALGGNEAATLNLTYRFPVLEEIDIRFLHLTFNKLYGSFIGDFGNAWNGTQTKLSEFKFSAGFELRLESWSFYTYPTRVFFGGAYGFDRFTRIINEEPFTYGKEWRFYFGVLFDFEI